MIESKEHQAQGELLRQCYVCHRVRGEPGVDLRPYGPQGQDVCFECAFATPAAKATTERQFVAQMDACPNGVSVIGMDVGPIPLSVILNEESHDSQ